MPGNIPATLVKVEAGAPSSKNKDFDNEHIFSSVSLSWVDLFKPLDI